MPAPTRKPAAPKTTTDATPAPKPKHAPEPEAAPKAEAAPKPVRADPSEPQLLPATAAPSAADEWPSVDSLRSPEVPPKNPDPDQWQRPEASDTFSTPHTRPQLTGTKSRTPSVDPVPEVPDGGLVSQVRYLAAFGKARWQRRGAIKTLKEQIASDTGSLDTVLGDLGAEVRKLAIDNRSLSAENAAIDEAEARKARADREFSEQQNHQAEENTRFADIEDDRKAKVEEAEGTLELAKQELGSLEAQRRGYRSKRKSVQSQQDGLVKAAEDREGKAAKLDMGEERATLRRSAEDLRREAASLDPDRQSIDRSTAALEKPIAVASSKVEALKAELESAKRSLNDAREGHRHKQSEIEAEKGKKSRELAQAEAEIKRRLVTLGTLVNLNRIDRDEFVETYSRIDVLRGAIGSSTTEIDRMSAERGAYDRQALVRGGLVLGGAVLAFILLIAILIWAI